MKRAYVDKSRAFALNAGERSGGVSEGQITLDEGKFELALITA